MLFQIVTPLNGLIHTMLMQRIMILIHIKGLISDLLTKPKTFEFYSVIYYPQVLPIAVMMSKLNKMSSTRGPLSSLPQLQTFVRTLRKKLVMQDWLPLQLSTKGYCSSNFLMVTAPVPQESVRRSILISEVLSSLLVLDCQAAKQLLTSSSVYVNRVYVRIKRISLISKLHEPQLFRILLTRRMPSV